MLLKKQRTLKSKYAIVFVNLCLCPSCRTLPRSLFVAIPIIILCYLLVNLAYFGVLCYEQILAADTVALVTSTPPPPPLYNHSLNLQTFGYQTLGQAGLVVIPLLVALSTFGSVLATMFAATRLMFVAARDGLFPQALSGLHRTYKTPVPAVMIMVGEVLYAYRICFLERLENDNVM